MFSVLCISNRAFSLALKAGIFLSQLWYRRSDKSFRYRPSRLTTVVLPSDNRLCLQMTPGSPDYFPYPSRPGSIRFYQCISLPGPGEDGSPLPLLLLHQLITASGCRADGFSSPGKHCKQARCQQTENTRTHCHVHPIVQI